MVAQFRFSFVLLIASQQAFSFFVLFAAFSSSAIIPFSAFALKIFFVSDFSSVFTHNVAKCLKCILAKQFNTTIVFYRKNLLTLLLSSVEVQYTKIISPMAKSSS